MPATLGPTFTTTQWVIDRVHSHTPDSGPYSQPSWLAGLANCNIFVVNITNLTDGRRTGQVNQTYLPRWQTHLAVITFFCD
jgi:hypothetical protein